MDKSTITNHLNTISGFPKKITDITENISKGAASVTKATDKIKAFVDKQNPRNPISQALFDVLGKGATFANSKAHKAEDLARNIADAGKIISGKIQPASDIANKISDSLNGLEQCKEVLNASALLVNAVIDTASGHFHPRANEMAFNQFNKQWDSWAKTVDGIFHGLSSDTQVNVLESFARENFGDNVYALGSAIKKESAGIFGGIADFEDSIKLFSGSYRNPAEAAAKIEQGVKGIIRATERVSNSLNNMIKTYQRGIGEKETGNRVLAYLGSIHDTKAISALNKVLSAGTGAFTLAADGRQFADALKTKNPLAIYSAGKQTLKDAKTVIDALKKGKDAAVKNMPVNSASNIKSRQAVAPQAKQEPQQKNQENNSDGNTDSYVCSKAKIKCSYGDKISKLTVYPDRTIWLTGEPQANISDHISMYNIAPFGKCHTTSYPATGSATAANHGKLTPMPCVPNTPFAWMRGKDDVLLQNQPALLKSSSCKCVWGGTITITEDGQFNGTGVDLHKMPKENFK